MVCSLHTPTNWMFLSGEMTMSRDVSKDNFNDNNSYIQYITLRDDSEDAELSLEEGYKKPEEPPLIRINSKFRPLFGI